jgi:hypothetical protein
MPLIQQIVAIIVLPLIAGMVYRYTGIKIEEKNMNTLQVALENAVGVQKVTGSMAQAQEYMRNAAPDAIAAFDLGAAQIADKIQAKAGAMAVKATGVTGSRGNGA